MAKGSSFEREISRKLSLWVSDGKEDDIFWRSDASGGRFTTNIKFGRKGLKTQAGDITFRKDVGKLLIEKFNLELKTGYSKKTKTKTGLKQTNWCIIDVIDSKQSEPTFLSFWNQTLKDANLTERIPLLIFRRPLMAPCIVFNYDFFVKIISNHKIYEDGLLSYCNTKLDINIIIINFNDFINWIKYTKFIENCSH